MALTPSCLLRGNEAKLSISIFLELGFGLRYTGANWPSLATAQSVTF